MQPAVMSYTAWTTIATTRVPVNPTSARIDSAHARRGEDREGEAARRPPRKHEEHRQRNEGRREDARPRGQRRGWRALGTGPRLKARLAPECHPGHEREQVEQVD